MTALAPAIQTSESIIGSAIADAPAPELTKPVATNGVPIGERTSGTIAKTSDNEKVELRAEEVGVDDKAEQDEQDEDDDEEEDDEDEDEEDMEAQAELFAKKLGDQLMAEIGRAFGTQPESSTSGQPNGVNGNAATRSSQSEASDSIVPAIQAVLQHATTDAHLLVILQHTVVPGYANLLECLQHLAETGDVQEETAEMLSNLIAVIATGCLPPAPEPSVPPESRKRKREGEDGYEEGPERKRATPAQVQELKAHLFATIAVISHALVLNNHAEGHITKGAPSRTQAEQILHFAHACAHRAEADDIEIQELGALVWMLRSLSGITPPQEGGPSIPIAMSADGKALYPCVHTHCGQTFHRLIDLRMHQEQAHDHDRPFRCKRCPASFMRNHDLKRHYNLHEKRTFVCGGCNKTYTRRDALKRHKDHPKGEEACRTTEIVELDRSMPPEMEHARHAATGQSDQTVTEQANAVVSQLFSLLAAQQPHPVYPPPPVDQPPAAAVAAAPIVPDPATALSSFGLSAEHTQLLQRAIAMTAESARQQAEREAQAEDYESEDGEESVDEEDEEDEGGEEPDQDEEKGENQTSSTQEKEGVAHV